MENSQLTTHNSTPDLLCIGFLCHDLYQGGNILGGTASYSSLMASHLGLKTAILTSVGNDFEFHDIFRSQGISICNKPAAKTTVFENIYNGEQRTQYIHDRSETLRPNDVPAFWKEVPIVKFCLIADEVDYSLLQYFPTALVAATIQGWLRQWDEKGKIRPKAMDWEKLQYVDIVFMSVDDIKGFENALPRIIDLVEIVVVTNGRHGAIVYANQEENHFPAYPIQEVDATGAGDIFAASFLFKYQETRDIAQAAAFAHAAASFIVETPGIQIPTKERIEERFSAYRSVVE